MTSEVLPANEVPQLTEAQKERLRDAARRSPKGDLTDVFPLQIDDRPPTGSNPE